MEKNGTQEILETLCDQEREDVAKGKLPKKEVHLCTQSFLGGSSHIKRQARGRLWSQPKLSHGVVAGFKAVLSSLEKWQ